MRDPACLDHPRTLLGSHWFGQTSKEAAHVRQTLKRLGKVVQARPRYRVDGTTEMGARRDRVAWPDRAMRLACLLENTQISVLPILALYAFARQYFVQGVVLSGIRG